MRLSEFIHDTLYEIVLGIQLGRARTLDLAAVTPGTIDGASVSETTYVDFDVAIVVGESGTKSREGDGKTGAEIQVVSIVKANVGIGGKIETSSKNSTEQTHRITFKVPVYLNANFKNNQAAAEEATLLLAAHGIDHKSPAK